jgi:hypothetical protein
MDWRARRRCLQALAFAGGKKEGEIARTQFPREEPPDAVRAVVLHAFGEWLASV